MENWPGQGAIPSPPTGTFDPRVQGYGAPSAPRRPTQDPDEIRKSIADVLASRQARDGGDKFWLKDTQMHARVRDLPFTDRVMLMGIPADMRDKIAEAVVVSRRARAEGRQSIETALIAAEANAALIDGVCIAGFIWPKLVRLEQERREHVAQGWDPEDVWLVEWLSDGEKEDYHDFVFRNRGLAQEDVARVAQFPGPGVEEAGVRNAG